MQHKCQGPSSDSDIDIDTGPDPGPDQWGFLACMRHLPLAAVDCTQQTARNRFKWNSSNLQSFCNLCVGHGDVEYPKMVIARYGTATMTKVVANPWSNLKPGKMSFVDFFRKDVSF
jgi:hypothetical protein